MIYYVSRERGHMRELADTHTKYKKIKKLLI